MEPRSWALRTASVRVVAPSLLHRDFRCVLIVPVPILSSEVISLLVLPAAKWVGDCYAATILPAKRAWFSAPTARNSLAQPNGWVVWPTENPAGLKGHKNRGADELRYTDRHDNLQALAHQSQTWVSSRGIRCFSLLFYPGPSGRMVRPHEYPTPWAGLRDHGPLGLNADTPRDGQSPGPRSGRNNPYPQGLARFAGQGSSRRGNPHHPHRNGRPGVACHWVMAESTG